MNKLENIINNSTSEESFCAEIVEVITGPLGKTGIVTKEQIVQIVKVSVELGILYSKKNKGVPTEGKLVGFDIANRPVFQHQLDRFPKESSVTREMYRISRQENPRYGGKKLVESTSTHRKQAADSFEKVHGYRPEPLLNYYFSKQVPEYFNHL